VLPDELQQVLGIGCLPAQAGDPIADLISPLAGIQRFNLALDLEDLFELRPIDRAV
jgi:hypothetical protein